MRASLRLRPAIVLFGDSLTQQAFGVVDGGGAPGWAALLAAAYTRRADVLNRGFSGYNTRHALPLLSRLFGARPGEDEILFCTVFFGANDAALPGEPQHVPLDEYGDNLRTIVAGIRERARGANPVPVLVLTPPPVDEVAWAGFRGVASSDRSNRVARAYGDRAKEVARELGCPVVDTWELLRGASDERGRYLSDGLHLCEEGNRLVFEGIMELLKREYPDLAPMDDNDGEGKYGKSGLPVEEKLWKELCGLDV